uniref:Uncharacterized protein n=1 Tax=Knipowitschia caucasica TaxID=637954 RepID=A0AAV2IUT8_KNICA
MVGDNEGNSPSHEEEDDEDDPVSLASILRELKDFRHENKEQFSEIQRNQQQTDARVTQAEARIDEVETALGEEEVIRIAWQKKQVMYKDTRFYVDHDYPPLILKKRTEYNQAKRVLKEHNIKFQTPYPAKLRVFYNEETRLYQSAAEATVDMAARGLPVTVIPSIVDPYQRELQRLSPWQAIPGDRTSTPPPSGTGSTLTSRLIQRPFIEKLREFRQNPPTDK